MDKKINNPYANLFEMVLSIGSEAKKLLQHFVDPRIANNLDYKELKLASGSFKGGETGLHNFLTDILYTCKWKGKDIFVNILLEHKSWFENPKLQLLLYLIEAYNKQKLEWKRAKEEVRKKGKKVSNKPFEHTLIIPVLFYHGKRKWKNQAFADQFRLPEEWLKGFIPDMEIILIDLDEYSDKYIEQIGASFIQPMLYLFKHKGEKDFAKQNSEKIFKFVEELTDDKQTWKFFKTILFIMIQNFNLRMEDVEEIIKHIPTKDSKGKAHQASLSMIDEAVQKGYLKGIKTGEEKGIKIGEEKGIKIGEEKGIKIGEEKGIKIGEEKGKQLSEIKKNIEITLELLKKVPFWKDEEIALVCKVKTKFVMGVRKIFQTEKEGEFKKFVQDTYNKVPNITEKDFLKLEANMINLWKKYKKSI